MKVSGYVLFLLALTFPLPAYCQTETTQPLGQPAPVLVFIGPEYVTTNGRESTRYRFSVENRTQYARDLFLAAPSLPPCGLNTRASRTWVDFYSQNGTRLNGFCALASPQDLNNIWFALERDQLPPSWIYLEMTDRQTNTKYKSNLAETTQ